MPTMRQTFTSLCAIACTSALTIQPRNVNEGMSLKIMPLGASITRGVDSSGGAGYRKDLQNIFRYIENPITFVGNVSYGDMDNNLCEAHPGYTIKEIDEAALSDGSYAYQPNIILLNAGTNDCVYPNPDPAGAPGRYFKLLSNIHKNAPDALIVASSLIPNLNTTVDECVRTINPGLENAVFLAAAEGYNVAWVDMYNVIPKSEINTKDNTHPTDAGYRLMAAAWFQAIMSSADKVKVFAQGIPVPQTKTTTS